MGNEEIKEIERRLDKLLQLDPDATDKRLNSPEDDQLEYKEKFKPSKKQKYVKTMMAFANVQGGFIVFGVEDEQYQLRGVNSDFDDLDSADLSNILRDHASSIPKWKHGTKKLNGVKLGYIYTYEDQNKPVITTTPQKGKGELKPDSIYYRYQGQTTVIRSHELGKIIEQRLEHEREVWRKLLQTLIDVGPTNVGVLNLVEGKLGVPGATFLINTELIEKIKFIRQGSFNETTGEPTLKLVGNVHEMDGHVVSSPTKVGIHEDDLLREFLTKRYLEPDEARNYLKETVRQNTHYVPIYYFVHLAGLSPQDAADMVHREENCIRPTAQATIVSRLQNKEPPIERMGSSYRIPWKGDVPRTSQELMATIKSVNPGDQRSLLVAVLISDPDIVQEDVESLPLIRLCEAMTHISAGQLDSKILDVFLRVLEKKKSDILKDANAKQAIRQAVAYLDQQLYESVVRRGL